MQIDKYRRRQKTTVSESTMNSRISALNNLKEYIGDKEPDVEDVEDWVDHMIKLHEDGDIKATTIKQYFKSARYYYRTINRDDRDLDHIKQWLPDNDTDHGDYLTKEELRKMMGGVYNHRQFAIYQLMYEYGRRPGEIRLLNLEDVDFEEDTITFIILKKKDLLRATFKLEEDSRNAIKRYLQYRNKISEDIDDFLDEINSKIDNPEDHWDKKKINPLFTTGRGRVSYSTIWRNIKNHAKSAGIEKNITPKSMRHSRATHLDWEGHSPSEIARHQLVHGADTDVISAYIHDREEDQIREVMTVSDEEEEDE